MGDPLEKTKSTKSFTHTKNIISISIEFTFANIDITIESVSNGVSISDSAYLLALSIFISEISKETLNGEELKQLHLKRLKEETQSVNLGVDDEPKIIQFSNTLNSSEKDELVALLKEFKEVFAWSFEDMLGIDTNIVQQCIPTNLTMKPIKQKLRRMKPEQTLQVKEEVEK